MKIIVLGAGFAGLRCSQILSRYFPNQVTLIDKNNYHLYLPLLYELNEKKVKLPIKTGAKFIQKEVNNYHEIDYDYLVLAVGADTNYYGIPGLKERALSFKTLEDIKKLKKIPSGEILIVGGGVTGVELACELALKLKNERIKIIESKPQILMSLDADLRRKAEKRLQKLGIEILTKHHLKAVKNQSVVLENGQVLPFDNLIWTGGVTLGQYKVNNYLQVKGEKNVFAVGDCASAYPGLIRPAMEQAKVAALNIKRSIKRRPLIAYQPKFRGIIIPLGGCYAIGKIGSIKIAGMSAWLLKNIINFIYIKTYGRK